MLSTELLVRPIQTQYNPIADRLTQPIYPPPQAPEQNIVKTCMNCIDIVGNNGLEWTVCKDAYHYRCSIPPITNYYQTLNCWKCSRCWSCNFAQHYWSWSNLIAIFFLYLTNIRDAWHSVYLIKCIIHWNILQSILSQLSGLEWIFKKLKKKSPLHVSLSCKMRFPHLRKNARLKIRN